jgi:hypothetical protein
MKNLVWLFGGDTEYVPYLVPRQTEVRGERVNGFSGEKQVDDVVDLRVPWVSRAPSNAARASARATTTRGVSLPTTP